MTIGDAVRKLVRERANYLCEYCHRLDLNDDCHNDGSIIQARLLEVKGGWHPPTDDPKL
jgi:hypothetical protein